MKSYIIYFIILSNIALSACVSQRESVIEGVKYEEGTDKTNYFVLPYGSVSVPGKWDKTHYNPVSRQQFFTNKDSVDMGIAFGGYNQFEFNTNGSKKGFEFVKAYYEWDSKYFVETYGLQRKIIEADSLNNYIIWKSFGTRGQIIFNSYFLFGEKNGNVSNFTIPITDTWTENEKIKFLKNLYLNKNQE